MLARGARARSIRFFASFFHLAPRARQFAELRQFGQYFFESCPSAYFFGLSSWRLRPLPPTKHARRPPTRAPRRALRSRGSDPSISSFRSAAAPRPSVREVPWYEAFRRVPGRYGHTPRGWCRFLRAPVVPLPFSFVFFFGCACRADRPSRVVFFRFRHSCPRARPDLGARRGRARCAFPPALLFFLPIFFFFLFCWRSLLRFFPFRVLGDVRFSGDF